MFSVNYYGDGGKGISGNHLMAYMNDSAPSSLVTWLSSWKCFRANVCYFLINANTTLLTPISLRAKHAASAATCAPVFVSATFTRSQYDIWVTPANSFYQPAEERISCAPIGRVGIRTQTRVFVVTGVLAMRSRSKQSKVFFYQVFWIPVEIFKRHHSVQKPFYFATKGRSLTAKFMKIWRGRQVSWHRNSRLERQKNTFFYQNWVNLSQKSCTSLPWASQTQSSHLCCPLPPTTPFYF